MSHYSEELEELMIKNKIMRERFKPGKQKEGKTEGARYCYMDLMPIALEWEDTTIHWACDHFNNFVYSRELDDLQSAVRALINTDDIIIKEVIEVRYHTIQSGKYDPQSYQEEMNVDDLLDAAARHMIQHLIGNERDEESGKLHLSHFCANMIMIAGQLCR